MFKEIEQYACRECGNVSWKEETCHGAPLERLCHCGSGKFPEECHGIIPPEPIIDPINQ